MASLTAKYTISGVGSPIEASVIKTKSLGQALDETIADSSTDLLVNWTCDISAAGLVVMLSDQNLTVKTNSSGAPQETIALVADTPLVWSVGDAGETAPFADDVTALYVTNASGSAASFKIRSVEDATP